MFANERQSKIAELISAQGSVTTSELMKCFSVSIETVRRDLLELEKRGVLLRVHGGAVVAGKIQPYHQLNERMAENAEKKSQLVKIAAEYVNNGDIISMDSGSTPVFFAKALKESVTELTIVTNSLDVLNELKDQRGYKIILTGGNYLADENCFAGVLAVDTISRIRVNKAFIFPVALSLKGGICNHTSDFVFLQREMIAAADKVFVLADSGKFEKADLLKQSDMLTEYTYITDSGLPPALKRRYEEKGFLIVTE